jgi:hypothetical protein
MLCRLQSGFYASNEAQDVVACDGQLFFITPHGDLEPNKVDRESVSGKDSLAAIRGYANVKSNESGMATHGYRCANLKTR